MKYDPSDQTHAETPRARVGLAGRWLISAGGGQADTVLNCCSPKEIADFKVRGAVLLGSSALSSVTAATIFHLAFGDGGFDPLLLAAGLGIGGLQGIIDSFVQYRGTIHSRGLAELRNARLKLPAPESALSASRAVRFLRVAQGATSGFLGGLVFMLAANGADIRAYNDNKFLTDNRAVAEQMSKMVDSSIGRSKDALALQTAELNNLSRAIQSLRANDVRRAIGASRRANQPSASAPDAQLAALEKRLTEETAKRDALKTAVERQEGDRNAAIERAVSPGHIPKRAGLSAQLTALGELTREDPKLLLFLVGFLLVSLALELGPMFCGATYTPSAFAARVTLDHFLEVTKLASAGAQELSARKPATIDTVGVQDQGAAEGTKPGGAPREANDNAMVMAGMNGAMPPRRPRGRPRKNGVDRPIVEPDHE
jgi:hypothetical protein